MTSAISAHVYEVARLMKNLLILTVLFVSFPITCLRADDKPLFAPRPTKDPMASKKHRQGAGIFEMIIDKPLGKVKEIVVAFTADKDAAFYPVGHTVHPTNRGFPAPFDEPVAPAELWQWFPERYGAAGHR
jgi:hypothetical protein